MNKKQLTIVAIIAAAACSAAAAGAFASGAPIPVGSPEVPANWRESLLSDHALSIFAIVLGFVGIALATRHDHQMGKQVEKLREITNAIPTHVSGSWGVHLRCIVDLVDKTPAGACIDVTTDCADYGSFFDPPTHAALFAAILAAKARGVRIRMLAGGPAQPITQTSPDHGMTVSARRSEHGFGTRLRTYLHFLRAEQDGRFETWLRERFERDDVRRGFLQWLVAARAPDADQLDEAALKERLEHCLRIYGRRNAAFDSGEDAAFKTLLLAREAYFEATLRDAGIAVQRLLSYEPMIFFWVRTKCVPHEEAAFIFAKSDRETIGSTMTSVDRHIVNGFSSIFEYQWSAAAAGRENALAIKSNRTPLAGADASAPT